MHLLARLASARVAFARLNPGIVIAVLVLAAGLWGFAELLDEVSEGDSGRFDTAVLLAFREAGDPRNPIGPWWLEIAMSDLTSLGSMAVLGFVTISVAGYLALTRRMDGALLVLFAVAGGAILSSLLKIGIDRPRPDLVAPLAEVHTLSFPSGHAMLSAVTYLTLGALLAGILPGRRTQIYVMAVAAATTAIVGASRVYLGVHWPTDVLAGWCVGAAWAMLCWLAARLLEGRVFKALPGPDDLT